MKRPVIPACYAGWARPVMPAQCGPARAGRQLGNCATTTYDFKIWFGERIREVRAALPPKRATTAGNQPYTNMLHHVPTVAGWAADAAPAGRHPAVQPVPASDHIPPQVRNKS